MPALAPCARVIWGEYWRFLTQRAETVAPGIPDWLNFLNRLLAKRHAKWTTFHPLTTPLETGIGRLATRPPPFSPPWVPPEALEPSPASVPGPFLGHMFMVLAALATSQLAALASSAARMAWSIAAAFFDKPSSYRNWISTS